MFNRFMASPRLLEAAQTAFVWNENLSKILTTAFLSMVPTFEGRYAVVTSIAMGMPVVFSYFLAVICSSIPVPIILLLLRPVLDWFYTLPIKLIQKFPAWLERRAARKREKMLQPKKGLMGWLSKRVGSDALELIGLYIFVALPLPGTGAWTGSAIATLFEMPRMKSALVIIAGNFTACLITTLSATGVFTLLG